MRIAFDLDGVLADLHGSFANTAIRLFPELDRSIVGSPEIGASPPDLEEFPTEIAAAPVANVSLTNAQSAAVWHVAVHHRCPVSSVAHRPVLHS